MAATTEDSAELSEEERTETHDVICFNLCGTSFLDGYWRERDYNSHMTSDDFPNKDLRDTVLGPAEVYLQEYVHQRYRRCQAVYKFAFLAQTFLGDNIIIYVCRRYNVEMDKYLVRWQNRWKELPTLLSAITK